VEEVNPSRRKYSSPRREQGARQTRRAILDAARHLFIARGYVATTIDDIAEAAEVSRPTVFSVGTKAELLKLVRDLVIAGDDEPVAVPDREPYARTRAAPDPTSTLRIHAGNVRTINARYVDIDLVLQEAADADPALRELWDASERQRLAAAAIVVDDIAAKGALGVERDDAIDILWLLMAPDHLRRLRSRGWTDDTYERWLADTMVSQLLPSK
jgi:AcrR family transcriptional regulator